MTFVAIPAGLEERLAEAFGLEIGPAVDQHQGEESIGWRVPSSAGELFIQRYPTWRTAAEIEWCYRVARAAAAHASEVVVPLVAVDGATAVVTPGGPVAVFPYVAGTRPDTASEDRRIEAAELLARLHRGVAGGELGNDPRPPSERGAPGALRSFTAVDELPDPDLDRWEDALPTAGFVTALVHGDFYPGNILCTKGRIVGVIDWLEADHDFVCQELGWAIWEFCQNDQGDDLIDERARAFLAAYLNAGGRVPVGELSDLLSFIRRRLRQEVGRERLAESGGGPFDPAYVNSEIRAFKTLGERPIDLLG